ncbi:hypothetical protein [Priestia megaterium]|uniref:hypothetical protein n=1 Tax=Priestia megaterium TaxID=1404 RepID=UPI001596EB90|nr:hypothetical protein [Priestia megaterium]
MKKENISNEIHPQYVPYCQKKMACCEFDAKCLASYKVLSSGATVYEGCGCRY